MRLINCHTYLLEEFLVPPSYAIVSHTWGEEEVSFQDMQELQRASQKRGFAKLLNAGRIASHEGMEWFWIDTCCIDKSSSAELSEAINSMFQWYCRSSVCLVYLEDIALSSLRQDYSFLKESKWFTRGWTLQELIAPDKVLFYDQEWNNLGEKTAVDLLPVLSAITSIDERILRERHLLSESSVAVKMSWAAGRLTTRTEDIAYCLMGIFDVNMPILYGEGAKAFLRLQEEILRTTDDTSLFAWCSMDGRRGYRGILAKSPDEFRGYRRDVFGDRPFQFPRDFSFTNKGLRIAARLFKNSSGPQIFMNLLEDHHDGIGIGIMIQESSGVYVRVHSRHIYTMALRLFQTPPRTIYILGILDSRAFLYSASKSGSAAKSLYPKWSTDDPIQTVDDHHSLWSASSNNLIYPHCRSDQSGWSACGEVLSKSCPSSQDERRDLFVPKDKIREAREKPEIITVAPSGDRFSSSLIRWQNEGSLSCISTRSTWKRGDSATSQATAEDAAITDVSFEREKENLEKENPFLEFRHEVLELASISFTIFPTWSGEGSARMLACPFYKRDQLLYRNCLKEPELKASSDILQHFSTRHRQPYYCPVCHATFEHTSVRDRHIVQRSCQPDVGERLDGVSSAQNQLLEAKLSHESSVEQQWFMVWDILFPKEPRPDTAYVREQTAITIFAIRDFWRDQGHQIIAGFLSSRGKLHWQVRREEQALADLHSAIFSDLMDRFIT